ncbi:MAG TPA: hypothetical protein VK427_02145, partial [Kofleriaceae bacterium]|nr:hypothetical protein [Kofleriaceae bacterium]
LDGYWVLSDALGVANLRDKRRAVVEITWAKLHGRSHRSFPWPPTIAVFVIVYSIAACIFAVYVAYRLLPHAASQLATVPQNVAAVWTATLTGDVAVAFSAGGRLVATAFVFVFAVALVRRTLRTLVAWVKRQR